MRITIETLAYNDRRHGKPWIAKVMEWKTSRPEIEWGAWHGQPGGKGTLEINAEPGDIIRYGQKDHRNARRSDNEWAVVQEDGTLDDVTQAQAREHWLNRQEQALPAWKQDVQMAIQAAQFAMAENDKKHLNDAIDLLMAAKTKENS